MEERSPFTHILVPIDGSPPSIGAGQLALQIASTHQVPVTLAYVVDSIAAEKMSTATSRPLDSVYTDLERKGRTYLEYLGRLARNRGLPVEQVTRRGIPHREIADLARECSADLIVIGQVGIHGPNRAHIGSVAQRVIESASCPVLVVRQAPGQR
jgi:nucleotide-binding universal stress UspA family protein